MPSVADMSVNTLTKRVAVGVTCKNFGHLVGVPVSLKGTGPQITEVVIWHVNRFGLYDSIMGISCDSTASNAGLIQGTCTRIEKNLTFSW